MTHTSTEQPSLAAIIHDLRESYARTSPGTWGKGATTHETVSRAEGREPYKVAEFRHANDAQFCDLAHVFVPRLLSEIEALQSRVQEVEATNTEVEKLKAAVGKLQQQLIAEAKKTAEEKLRADQLDKQHTMQSQMLREALRRTQELEAQASEVPLAIPKGWKLVPEDANHSMLESGKKVLASPACTSGLTAQAVYKAMIYAAPLPPDGSAST